MLSPEIKFTNLTSKPETSPLPPIFTRDPDSRLRFSPDIIEEGENGPFDLVAQFGHQLSVLQTPVSLDQYAEAKSTLTRTIFMDTHPRIASGMRAITETANDPKLSPLNPDHRFIYQEILATVVDRVLYRASDYISTTVILMPPLNGGRFIAERFRQIPLRSRAFREFHYRASRIIQTDGAYNVGLRLNSPAPEVPRGATVIFADDCIAGVGTCLASLSLLPHTDVNLVIAASAVTVRGAAALETTLPRLGFANFTIIAGAPVLALNDHYYLLRTVEEGFPAGTYFVGDMGKWLAPLS